MVMTSRSFFDGDSGQIHRRTRYSKCKGCWKVAAYEQRRMSLLLCGKPPFELTICKEY